MAHICSHLNPVVCQRTFCGLFSNIMQLDSTVGLTSSSLQAGGVLPIRLRPTLTLRFSERKVSIENLAQKKVLQMEGGGFLSFLKKI